MPAFPRCGTQKLCRFLECFFRFFQFGLLLADCAFACLDFFSQGFDFCFAHENYLLSFLFRIDLWDNFGAMTYVTWIRRVVIPVVAEIHVRGDAQVNPYAP